MVTAADEERFKLLVRILHFPNQTRYLLSVLFLQTISKSSIPLSANSI